MITSFCSDEGLTTETSVSPSFPQWLVYLDQRPVDSTLYFEINHKDLGRRWTSAYRTQNLNLGYENSEPLGSDDNTKQANLEFYKI